MANDPVVEGMTDTTQTPLSHMRYGVHQLSAIVTDPYSGKKKYIVLQGTGTMLIEAVMRNRAEEDNKAKKFDGNQASVTLSIVAIKEDPING